ncbi:nucleoporin subcomplex protein binding to Pom34-domain-containing protein [Boletus edulis BED1]|uniref:Nucleoporin NUP188 n=1 Tax=Boletus edulis BED1 TaxID=1328754 RepID=A0AAD4GAH0_BOLED|nr:nucleoporin subcomplex protein binding to Pom34-domain-containing protein [Boletus edulis BED1]
MSGESSQRSSLIDITYQQLHSFLTGRRDGGSVEQISQKIAPRASQIRHVSKPYGQPTPASRKAVESGTVTLPDGCVSQVDDLSKEFAIALSSHFEIDEIQAFVLLRSFLYNEGLSISSGSSSDKSLVEELITAITPFYYSERLFLLRVLIPLFRAHENSADPIHAVATKNLPNIVPDGRAFANSLVAEYLRKTQESISNAFGEDPGAASRWAKQSSREQLAMLEVLFWTMWGYVPCEADIVVKLLEAAYNTNLGSSQRSSTLLLDEEGMQILQDIAGLWMLITIEILELERIAEPDGIEISAAPADTALYAASPDSLKRIHDLVTSNPGNQHACAYLGWAFVLSRIDAKIMDMKEVPDSYRSFYDSIHTHPSRSKEREPTYVLMGRVALSNEAGLFKLLYNLLTTSPLFVTAVAWKAGSTVTDPNAIAFRSVLKGFLMAVVQLVPVELIPDFDSLVEVWIALFGRSESRSVAGICRQFWQSDWRQGVTRRAIVDVARSRFPIHFRPLVRLLRAMTASGFLDTDPLSVTSSAEYSQSVDEEEEAERELCARHVFYYMDKLPTFSLVIPLSSCTGPNAVYERVQYGRSASAPGLTYTNIRAIRLPGGSIIPPRSVGRLLSGDGGEFVAICWQHEYGGWKVILDVLAEYVTRRSSHAGTTDLYQDVTFGRTGPGSSPLTLRLEDVGMEIGDEGDEVLATDALDLIRSVIQDKPILAEELLESLESGDPTTQTESSSADLVQLTTMILEEALSSRQPRGFSRTQLVTSAMSVLSALLTLPKYSLRVWLYIRSATALFGSSRSSGFAAVALPAERATGQYTMTLALLNLVQQLLQEAFASVLTIPPDNQRLRQVKEEVLMRAANFVHGEIWVEHLSWKYARLGDRFEIGRRISSFYANILFQSPPAISNRPFPTLSQAVIDTFLHKATTSTINPLVSAIAASPNILGSLYNARRFGDVRRLIYLLESHLQLTRSVLNYKQAIPNNNKPSLLEQALCAKVAGGAGFSDSARARVDPVDVLATFVKERDVGTVVPLEAIRVLHALCASLSLAVPSPPTIIGHLSNPEATVASLVRIVEHPYEDFSLRSAVWSFISLAVDKAPALSKLLVTGEFIIPSSKGKERENENEKEGGGDKKSKSALEIATETLGHWKDLWEANPALLASVLHFIHVVWQHGLEHQSVIEGARQNKKFWDQIAAVAREELGPDPDYTVESFVAVDGERQSILHEAVSAQAYRGTVKSYAISIIGQDIFLQPAPKCATDPLPKPLSYTQFIPSFKGDDQLNELILEGASSCYDPSLYDRLSGQLSRDFPNLSLDQLHSQDPVSQREFGDNFTFSPTLLRSRLQQRITDEEDVDSIEKQVLSINLNLSLSHAQTAMAEAWQFLLRQMLPFIRVEQGTRPSLLALASTISAGLAQEKRGGDMMATIHGVRLSLMLSVLEVAWFSTTDSDPEVESFMALVTNVHELLQNEAQPPSASFLGKVSVPFHRTLLQILYFCVRQCRNLATRAKVVNAGRHLKITGLVEATSNLVVDALRLTFDSARTRLDLDLDRDMELLVAVFEQCTRPDVSASSLPWLTRCQETGVIKSSLELLVRTDIAGLSDLPLLRARRMPLYAPHIFLFHMSLVSIPSGAERFASEGVITAYSNNSISAAISDGLIDVTLPELPGERSPAHKAYCYMLSIVAGDIYALGNQHRFFSEDACGMIQLYGKQIARALSWSIGDPITLPLLEEMEQTVNLFYAIAESALPITTNPNPVVTKVLRVFSTRALVFLQQLNYALTHPNHLARLLEPVTPEERVAMEKEPMDSSLTQLEMLDPRKHPLTARLVHMMFRLCSSIVSTLVSISRAYDVLLKEQEEWPLHEALIVPHSKVVLGEPTSLGTLLELANCTLDVLRSLVNRPAGQAIVPSTSIKDVPLAVEQATLTARRTLEALLVYAVTQLAMWLAKPDFDPVATEAEAEEYSHSHNAPLDANKGRAPRALAERLRRGMTGEMTADLQALLTRARPVLAKSEEVLSKSEGGKDLTLVLSRFLTERIVGPA